MAQLRLGIVGLAFAYVVGLPAHAQESREREALRRSQQQVYKLQQDNAALQREKQELQQKVENIEDALKKSQDEGGRLRRASKSLQTVTKEKEALHAKLSREQQQASQTAEVFKAQVSGLRRETADLKQAADANRQESARILLELEKKLKDEGRRASICEQNNAQLYSVTTDLIDRYQENRGVWEKFLLSEPFTRLKSVEVENLLDDMRNKAKDHEIGSSAAPQADDRNR